MSVWIWRKRIEVNGIDFVIGMLNDSELYGPVFEISKNGKRYGCRCVTEEQRELGFNSGVYATDEEVDAIEKAREILNTEINERRLNR